MQNGMPPVREKQKISAEICYLSMPTPSSAFYWQPWHQRITWSLDIKVRSGGTGGSSKGQRGRPSLLWQFQNSLNIQIDFLFAPNKSFPNTICILQPINLSHIPANLHQTAQLFRYITFRNIRLLTISLKVTKTESEKEERRNVYEMSVCIWIEAKRNLLAPGRKRIARDEELVSHSTNWNGDFIRTGGRTLSSRGVVRRRWELIVPVTPFPELFWRLKHGKWGFFTTVTTVSCNN